MRSAWRDLRFLDYARNDKEAPNCPIVISTKRSAWRDLMGFLDYARNDINLSAGPGPLIG